MIGNFDQSYISHPSIIKVQSIVDLLLERFFKYIFIYFYTIFYCRARLSSNKLGFVYLDDGERIGVKYTFHQLSQRAKAIGAYLVSKNCTNRCCLMLYPFDGLYFIEGL
jgi:hypothetical protein